MAKLETRKFRGRKFLLIISESEEESKLIDSVMGKKIPTNVRGEITLSDGYAEHYIRLEAKDG